MPAAYQIPPWLQPTDAVGAMTRGAELGQRAASLSQNYALATQRLDQEQQNFEREAQIKEEIAQMQQQRDAQQMAMEDAYNQARIGLQRSDLDLKAQQMARDFAAQQQYKNIFSQLTAPADSGGQGLDPTEAAIQAAFRVPELGVNIGQLAALRKAQPIPPPTMIPPPEGVTGIQGTMWQPGHAGFDVIREPKEAKDAMQMFVDRQDIKDAESIIKDFQKNTLGPPGKDASQRQIDAYQKEIDQVNEAVDTLRRLSPNSPYIPKGRGGGTGKFRVLGEVGASGAPAGAAVQPMVPFSGAETPPPFQPPFRIPAPGSEPQAAPPPPAAEPARAPEQGVQDYEIKQVDYFNRPDYESIVKSKLNQLPTSELDKLASEKAGIHSFPPSMTREKVINAIFNALKETGSDLQF